MGLRDNTQYVQTISFLARRVHVSALLATYSNLENHPRLIRARNNKPVPKIRLDPKTGLPSLLEEPSVSAKPLTDSSVTDEGEDALRRKSPKLPVGAIHSLFSSRASYCHASEERVRGGEESAKAGGEVRASSSSDRQKSDEGTVFEGSRSTGSLSGPKGTGKDA